MARRASSGGIEIDGDINQEAIHKDYHLREDEHGRY